MNRRKAIQPHHAECIAAVATLAMAIGIGVMMGVMI